MEDNTQLKILIVDDMQTIRVHARSMLEGNGYRITEAANGVEALEKIRREHPNLVLMDIVMPLMDGISCCAKVKSDTKMKKTKVIMVTGAGEYEKIAESFRAGCDDYITKPIDRDELTRKVSDLCGYILARQKLRSFKDKDDTNPVLRKARLR